METFLDELDIHLEEIKHYFERSNPDAQWLKLLEEGGELVVELSKSKFDWTNDKVVEEEADYIIVGRQLLDEKYILPKDGTDIVMNNNYEICDMLLVPYILHRKSSWPYSRGQMDSLRRNINYLYARAMVHGSLDQLNYKIFE